MSKSDYESFIPEFLFCFPKFLLIQHGYQLMHPHKRTDLGRQSFDSLEANPLYGRTNGELHNIICRNGKCVCNSPSTRSKEKVGSPRWWPVVIFKHPRTLTEPHTNTHTHTHTFSSYFSFSSFSLLLLFFALCTGPGTHCHPFWAYARTGTPAHVYPAHMHAHTFPRPVDSSANLLPLFMSISSCCYFSVFSSVCIKHW